MRRAKARALRARGLRPGRMSFPALTEVRAFGRFGGEACCAMLQIEATGFICFGPPKWLAHNKQLDRELI